MNEILNTYSNLTTISILVVYNFAKVSFQYRCFSSHFWNLAIFIKKPYLTINFLIVNWFQFNMNNTENIYVCALIKSWYFASPKGKLCRLNCRFNFVSSVTLYISQCLSLYKNAVKYSRNSLLEYSKLIGARRLFCGMVNSWCTQ